MKREELEGLTKPELIDLVLGMQRPDKTSRTSSKPPSTDRKAKRESWRPGGAKLGHKGYARVLAEVPDAHEDHRPAHCDHCGLAFAEDASCAVIGEYDEIDLLEIKPLVRRHRRLKCRCAMYLLTPMVGLRMRGSASSMACSRAKPEDFACARTRTLIQNLHGPGIPPCAFA
ncbi:hypothetical protein [Sphingomonas sp. 10B4]|uniref:hypothetical protein n=1 Tax=Sphingomonas sp. 10B4 TaxID=3048575 RepID=UPI002AB429FC|nr:hypothetical protein [Sphingomonas sp. 10B4]MDY7524524.1 hypothetical protein [Sphingomonas sp. 10B4]